MLEPGTQLGDWQIEAQIGEGGMGTVYSAVHAVIGKRAAIKVIRGKLVEGMHAAERFLTEARAVNAIQHPNIVDIFDLGELDDGRPYLVMELLPGLTLGDRLEQGRVPATEAIDLLLQICNALGAAHAAGVVHRDLKPDNVILYEQAGGTVVKLVDWGIAKMKDRPADAPDVTGAGTMVGTPRYVAPEQARGLVVDERTDIYSLGCIAHELFLEAPPFSCDNVADLLACHLKEPVAPPSEVWPDIPPVLETLLLGMLEKEADRRPTLSEITARLEEARRALGERMQTPQPQLAIGSGRITATRISGTEPTVLEATAEPVPMRRIAWSGVIAGGIALVIAVAFARLFSAQAAVAQPLEPLPIVQPDAVLAAPAPTVVAQPDVSSSAAPPATPDEITPPPRKSSPASRNRAKRTRIDPDATIDPFN